MQPLVLPSYRGDSRAVVRGRAGSDLETLRIGAPYIYKISSLRVKD